MKRARRNWRNDDGFTLTGMMVGLALGMLVTLALLLTFRVTRDSYASVADSVEIEERGQRALAIIGHAIRQAGWIPGHVALAPSHPAPVPPIEGRDDCAQPSVDTQLRCARVGVLRSDALLVRTSGSGVAADPGLPDGTMSDCGGYALPARAMPSEGGALPYHAAANLFYIGIAGDGVPQLLCRYPRRHDTRVRTDAYTAGTLVRGVESLQLRYGIDADGDGMAERFVSARTASSMGDGVWHRVRAVQVAVVVRGERPTVPPGMVQRLVLLPPEDGTARAEDALFQPATHPRLRRRAFVTTIRLRNASPCLERLC
ncbi:PilW family protein [Cupriavidus agavae]|uniref:Type IV pilus assembly protein PilW n=1 Tax=Cupriavidus agavae TaxID=1001822 RepID=A0A4Q7S6T9_9BURK|nr:PilW family protein [Cupriavidus agavae]RZT41390.1 type IV pilus assembly protein PilW [Cupriavidus agavae]